MRGRSTPVQQLDGSSSRSKFDSNEEYRDDSNGKWIIYGRVGDARLFATFQTENSLYNTANYIRYVLHQL